MNKKTALEVLGALQMIEPLIKSSKDRLAIDAFCFIWNTVANYAEEREKLNV